MRSILQTKKECYVCRHALGSGVDLTDSGLEEHHIFNGPDRNNSTKYGMVVWLCPCHHRTGKDSVHKNIDAKRMLQIKAQEAFEKRYGHEKFMEVFARNYKGMEPKDYLF